MVKGWNSINQIMNIELKDQLQQYWGFFDENINLSGNFLFAEVSKIMESNFNETSAALTLPQKQSAKKPNPMIFSPFEEIGLRVDSKNTEDIEELNMILQQILTYPSTELAELHKQANRLGNHDIREHQNESGLSSKVKEEGELSSNAIYCHCCGFIKQQQQIKLCTNLNDINNLGISTFLYFQTLKSLSILLGIMAIVYSLFALATNIVASNKGDPTTVSSYIPQGILSISVGPKEQFTPQQYKTYYYVQCWIGLALVIIWGIAFAVLEYFEKKNQIRVEDQTVSASDFSVIIEYMPTEIDKEQLQKQLDHYFNTITNVPPNLLKPFKIAQFNVGKPFYLNQADLQDQQIKQISKEAQTMMKMFVDWIYERQESATFSTTREHREQQYKKYDDLVKRRQKKREQLIQKVKDQYKKQNPNETTTVFITFETNYARKLFVNQNSEEISDKIRYYLTCCRTSNRFSVVTKDGVTHPVKITRAPEPEDIIWVNLGVSAYTTITRKIFTYIITLILLGLSFAAVYGLSVAQVSNSNNSALSVIISIVITLINIILGVVIRILTKFERDYTETRHQTSLGLKTILAQLINSILTPIIANWFIKGNNLYSKNGLAEDIFYQGLTNAFLTPILKFVDIGYIISRLTAWYSKRICTFDLILARKMWLDQMDQNIANELLFFQIGFEYIYIVNLFLFTCFFVSLQPIIVFFSLSGYFIMYWGQKYSLFNRCKRPIPGTDLVNTAFTQLILIGGILYAFGSLCWSNIFPDGTPKQALIPNLIAMAFGVLVFLFPYSAIFDQIMGDETQKLLVYQENRVYFPSEYNRLNPSTSEEGFEEYMKHIEKVKEKMKNASKQDQQNMAKKFLAQGKRGAQRLDQFGAAMGTTFGGAIGGMNAMRQAAFFRPPQQPSFNAMFLGQQIVPQTMQIQSPSLFNPQSNMMQGNQQNYQQQNGFQQAPPSIFPQQRQVIPQNMGFQQEPSNFGFQKQGPLKYSFQQAPPQQFGFQSYQRPFGFGQQQVNYSQQQASFKPNPFSQQQMPFNQQQAPYPQQPIPFVPQQQNYGQNQGGFR